MGRNNRKLVERKNALIMTNNDLARQASPLKSEPVSHGRIDHQSHAYADQYFFSSTYPP